MYVFILVSFPSRYLNFISFHFLFIFLFLFFYLFIVFIFIFNFIFIFIFIFILRLFLDYTSVCLLVCLLSIRAPETMRG